MVQRISFYALSRDRLGFSSRKLLLRSFLRIRIQDFQDLGLQGTSGFQDLDSGFRGSSGSGSVWPFILDVSDQHFKDWKSFPGQVFYSTNGLIASLFDHF
jgi:hypothetical protein